MLRLKGGERTQLMVEGKESDVKKALKSIKEIKSLETSAGEKGIINVVVESEKDIRKMLAKNIVTEGLGLLELSTDRFTLEDIFLHLTTKEEEVA